MNDLGLTLHTCSVPSVGDQGQRCNQGVTAAVLQQYYCCHSDTVSLPAESPQKALHTTVAQSLTLWHGAVRNGRGRNFKLKNSDSPPGVDWSLPAKHGTRARQAAAPVGSPLYQTQFPAPISS